MMQNKISADFPFKSRFVEVNGSRMHYIEEGKGNPILFLHGNPTSSYLWRNIIPHLTECARCVAPDLIGMGQSDKPDISYRFADHYEYVKGFIEKLGLSNITLVVHDWGSALGFHYAGQHPEKIKGLAFMEAIYRVPQWTDLGISPKIAFKMLRTPFLGWMMVSVGNMFVNKILPDLVIRDLSEEEMEAYQKPYPTILSRRPVRVWPEEVPFDGHPEDVAEIVTSYNAWLQETSIPKLCFYAEPGLIIQKNDTEWISENFPNVQMVNLGKGLHFVQEDHPHKIGRELKAWYEEISWD